MERVTTQNLARPILLYVYAAAAFPLFFEVSHWVTLASIALIIWSSLSMRQKLRPIPEAWLGAATVGSALLIYLEFKTFLTPDAATPLLLLLGGLKTQELRKLRDAVSLLFICTLITMSYLLYSQTLLATLYMFALVLGIALTFMVIHSPPNKVREILRSSPRLVAKDTLFALPIFLAFFFLFPRFQTGWGRSNNEAQTKTGFNDSFQPGEFSKLAKSNEPAFRVTFQTKAHPLMKDFYWRGLVFDKTDGWSWSRHQRKWHTEMEEPQDKTYDFEVTLEPKYQKNIFVLEKTSGLEWVSDEEKNPLVKETDGIYTSTWPNLTRVQYHGWTIENAPTEEMDSREQSFYTQLPNKLSARARELAKRLIDGKKTLDEQIRATLDFYTEKEFQYSLTSPEMKDLDAFLFNDRIGFCEHFASSFALLMRANGIPARVVTGFHGGEMNSYGHYFLVRDSNAHAWVEVYDASLKTWRRVDPTAAVAANRINLGMNDETVNSQNYLAGAFYSSQMLWDSINNRYTQLLMNYDFGQQKDLLSIGEDVSFKRYQIFLILILAVAILIFFISFRFQRAAKVPQSQATQLFQKLLRQLRTKGIQKAPHEGPWQFARRAANEWPEQATLIVELINQYVDWEYGTHSPSPNEIVRFKGAVKSLKPR